MTREELKIPSCTEPLRSWYEVTLDDGWRTRLIARNPTEALAKAERYHRGSIAESVTPCKEPKYT